MQNDTYVEFSALQRIFKIALAVSIFGIALLAVFWKVGAISAEIALICIGGLLIMAAGDLLLLIRYSRQPTDTDLPDGD